MARLFSQTLIRHSSPSTLSTKSPPLALSSRILAHRNRSNQPGKAQLIELDLESDGDVDVLGIRKLEDVIHRIIVQRSAPDWLPFVPGSSYWVPPRRRPHNILELIGKLANPMTEEESLALTTVRGWPSSDYYIQDSVSANPAQVQVEVEVEVEVETNSKNTSRSEDEEG